MLEYCDYSYCDFNYCRPACKENKVGDGEEIGFVDKAQLGVAPILPRFTSSSVQSFLEPLPTGLKRNQRQKVLVSGRFSTRISRAGPRFWLLTCKRRGYWWWVRGWMDEKKRDRHDRRYPGRRHFSVVTNLQNRSPFDLHVLSSSLSRTLSVALSQERMKKITKE